MLLVIDNYDSFSHNLARYLRRLYAPVEVVRNDQIRLAEIERKSPQAIVLSPGPCTPNEAGLCVPLIRELDGAIPILGVCLGHQAIAVAYGGMIERCKPVHGRASDVHHNGTAMFDGVPSPFQAARYHSLCARKTALPPVLDVTAWTEDRVVMAIEHQEHCVVGLQFHPESILTPAGYRLLANFLERSGVEIRSDPRSCWSKERLTPPETPLAKPITPIPF